MEINDIMITKKITERFFNEFSDNLDVDVAIAGAGPTGLVAARYLALANKKVVIFERKLSPGGGMWGGGMTFPVVVLQEQSLPILKDVGVRITDAGDGYYTANSIESVSKLCSAALDSGAKLFNAISVEDVMVRSNCVTGLVINWSAVQAANLHVDPMTVRAKAVIDATGHAAEICNIVIKKVGKLKTPSGNIEGEKSMWAEVGEKTVVENTKEVYPGLYVAGMAANAVFGGPRMGPIFGGMLLSGKTVTELILKNI